MEPSLTPLSHIPLPVHRKLLSPPFRCVQDLPSLLPPCPVAVVCGLGHSQSLQPACSIPYLPLKSVLNPAAGVTSFRQLRSCHSSAHPEPKSSQWPAGPSTTQPALPALGAWGPMSDSEQATLASLTFLDFRHSPTLGPCPSFPSFWQGLFQSPQSLPYPRGIPRPLYLKL